MSHVDEGTLHALLDGELTPVEQERVDSHLKGCPACQARLAEERAIIERASRLLGMATPPDRAVPPLNQLHRRRTPWWHVRRPLVWAATVILAVGLGWFARGRAAPDRTANFAAVTDSLGMGRFENPGRPVTAVSRESAKFATPPPGHLAMRQPARRSDSIDKDRDARQRQLQSTEVVTGAAASNAVSDRETTAVATLGAQKVDATPLPSTAPAAVTVRGQAATARAAPEQRPAAAPAPQQAAGADAASGVVTIDGYRTRRAPVLMSTSWPLIARQPARDVLGAEPVVIPGFAVRAYRRNPATREIAVEQVTDAGTTISLIERRVEIVNADERRTDSAAANAPRAMAKSVNERLARFVGPLRIEIEGPLTPDSLSSLLELAR